MSKILFSPIGDTDPIRNQRDGSMLHIVRHYHPNHIVLILSKEMIHKRALCEGAIHGVAPSSTVEVVERSDLDEVQDYDALYSEFESQLTQIRGDHRDAELLLNVSSGTPAMKSALLVWHAFTGHGSAVQVSTPQRGSNAQVGHDSGESLKDLSETNLDNEQEAPNRCTVVRSLELKRLILLEQVKRLVSVYDYAPASELARQVERLDPRTFELIRDSANRLSLSPVPKGVKRFEPHDDLGEFLFVMEVRLRKGQFGDFVRMISPALMETLMRHLDAVLPREVYLRSGGLAGEIDQELVNKNGLREFFREPLDRRKKNFVGGDALLRIIRAKKAESPERLRTLQQLRDFEVKVRNPAAHEIRTITSSFAQEVGALSFSDVMRRLYEVNEVKPGLYDRINHRIMELLETHPIGYR